MSPRCGASLLARSRPWARCPRWRSPVSSGDAFVGWHWQRPSHAVPGDPAFRSAVRPGVSDQLLHLTHRICCHRHCAWCATVRHQLHHLSRRGRTRKWPSSQISACAASRPDCRALVGTQRRRSLLVHVARFPAPDGGIAMPAFGSALSSEAIWDLIDYLHARNAGESLSRTGKWLHPLQVLQFDAECADGGPSISTTCAGACCTSSLSRVVKSRSRCCSSVPMWSRSSPRDSHSPGRLLPCASRASRKSGQPSRQFSV